jgi:hypothetical protein
MMYLGYASRGNGREGLGIRGGLGIGGVGGFLCYREIMKRTDEE